MRHTRMRQIAKAHGEAAFSHLWRKEVGTDTIEFQRYWMTLGLKPRLDPTFKWHRERTNRVEFDIKAGSMQGTVILPVKWKEFFK